MHPVLKGLLITAALVLSVIVLFTYVFPWVERSFITDPTLASTIFR